MITIKSLGSVHAFLDYLITSKWAIDWWDEYSIEWKLARGKIFGTLGNQCNRCGNPHNLHLHHIYGRNLDGLREGEINPIYLETGRPFDEIFEILCRICHSNEHGRPIGEAVFLQEEGEILENTTEANISGKRVEIFHPTETTEPPHRLLLVLQIWRDERGLTLAMEGDKIKVSRTLTDDEREFILVYRPQLVELIPTMTHKTKTECQPHLKASFGTKKPKAWWQERRSSRKKARKNLCQE